MDLTRPPQNNDDFLCHQEIFHAATFAVLIEENIAEVPQKCLSEFLSLFATEPYYPILDRDRFVSRLYNETKFLTRAGSHN